VQTYRNTRRPRRVIAAGQQSVLNVVKNVRVAVLRANDWAAISAHFETARIAPQSLLASPRRRNWGSAVSLEEAQRPAVALCALHASAVDAACSALRRFLRWNHRSLVRWDDRSRFWQLAGRHAGSARELLGLDPSQEGLF